MNHLALSWNMGTMSLLNVTGLSGIGVAPNSNPVSARLNPASNNEL